MRYFSSFALFVITSCGLMSSSYGQNVNEFKSSEEKEAFYKSHPELTQPAVNQNPVSEVSKEEVKTIANEPGYTPVDLPGFPVYVNTGNPEQDAANYEAAKMKWYEEVNSKGTIDKLDSSAISEQTVEIIPKSLYDLYPEEKKMFIISHPELFKVLND